MPSASSWIMNHQMTASAGVKVLPEALQDRTTACRVSRRARRICRSFDHGFR